MKRTPEQNKRLHGLLGTLGISPEVKADMVNQCTGGRETSSSKMTVDECQALINSLENEVVNLDKKRKRVISHLREAGYTLPNGLADMAGIRAWVLKQKYKKDFNQHTSEELSQLIHAASAVRKHFLSKQ